jgi:hypothetical protein
MFQTIKIPVERSLIDQAKTLIPDIDFRLSINQTAGNFFYDPWVIKDEFKNSVWEKILDTLPYEKGEARLIKLDPGTCYIGHSDIDDRWHLSINASDSFLIDLNNNTMFKTEVDYTWHYIDAGVKHSAVNFGNKPRVQLVVRKLLNKGIISNPVNIRITLKNIIEERRYIFDSVISPWLNKYNKLNKIKNFNPEDLKVEFTTEEFLLTELSDLIKDYFNIEILNYENV